VKIYLGLDEGATNTVSSIWTDIGMLLIDLAIILYSVSTLLGTNAEFLAKRFKRMGIDTALIWLIFSKVAYEFIHHFPYSIFEAINIPWVQALTVLNNDIINLAKNIAVLAFFIILLLGLGIYEIRKYARKQKELKNEVDYEVKDLISPKPTFEEPHPTFEEPQSITEEPHPIIGEPEIKEGDDTLSYQEEDVDDDKNPETILD
jgi:hypothetical protein